MRFCCLASGEGTWFLVATDDGTRKRPLPVLNLVFPGSTKTGEPGRRWPPRPSHCDWLIPRQTEPATYLDAFDQRLTVGKSDGEGDGRSFSGPPSVPTTTVVSFSGSRHKIGKGGGHVVPSRLSFPLREINTRFPSLFIFQGGRRRGAGGRGDRSSVVMVRGRHS
ncbi:SRF-type transcription factor (DNA-binding and dimerization domain) [Musa troglodytarum]|uniref:SRF-type transcription factor (DNA-binding and dimerization domain) n=1 Tax=Musa troglodytarum TaxID=320322 RepID=A0A9E7EUE6_9LILI|nr:SRF-type transcription factor (DNA-binding and dimerization domain) [Musa troglodytarum]